MSMSHQPTRRKLLKSAAAGAAAFTILPSGLARTYAANERVNVAIVGVDGQGGVNRKWLAKDGANVVALCDVDRAKLDKARNDHPAARPWKDYREMLERQ